MEISRELKALLNQPCHKTIRVSLECDKVRTEGGYLTPGLTYSIFTALDEKIGGLFFPGVTLKAIFYTIKDEFKLPDFINLQHFYKFQARKKSEAKEAEQRAQEIAYRPSAPRVSSSQSASILSKAHSVAQSVLSPVIKSNPQSNISTNSSSNIIFRPTNIAEPKAWNFDEAAKLVPFNSESVILKANYEKAGQAWPRAAFNREMLAVPGKVTNYAEVKEFWSHISNGALPVPKNLYPLTPDSSLYPFADKKVRYADSEFGYSFLVDDDGFIYDPLLVSKMTFGVPLALPNWLAYDSAIEPLMYHDLLKGFGNYQVRGNNLIYYILAIHKEINSFMNISSLDDFINLKRGICAGEPKRF